MKIKTKFSCGDVVFTISRESKEVRSACSACQGSGCVPLSGEIFDCPKCYGKGYRTNWEPESWLVGQGSMTIGQVRVEHTDSKPLSDVFDNYKAQKGYKEDYMICETGVGTGKIWRAENIFSTREDAEAEATRRNDEAQDN